MFNGLNLQDLINYNKNSNEYFLKKNLINLETYKFFNEIIDTYLEIFEYQILIYNNFKNTYYKKLKIYQEMNDNEPNFIIYSSGQSNAGGYGSFYDPNNPDDQPNENLFSYDLDKKKWVIADLRDSSLGDKTICRTPGTNLFVFQFAKNLMRKYPGIKPGIINVCSGGTPIAAWTYFNPNEK